MALSETQNGTQTATISTEHTLGSEETADAYFQLAVDTSNLANGDVLIIRAKLKVKTGGTARTVFTATVRDVQAEPGLITIPIPNIYGITFTLTQISGTGRNFDWSILKSA